MAHEQEFVACLFPEKARQYRSNRSKRPFLLFNHSEMEKLVRSCFGNFGRIFFRQNGQVKKILLISIGFGSDSLLYGLNISSIEIQSLKSGKNQSLPCWKLLPDGP